MEKKTVVVHFNGVTILQTYINFKKKTVVHYNVFSIRLWDAQHLSFSYRHTQRNLVIGLTMINNFWKCIFCIFKLIRFLVHLVVYINFFYRTYTRLHNKIPTHYHTAKAEN